VVEWGTTERQKTAVGDLSNIAEVAREAGIKPPAITIIGQVVKLRDQLQWFEPSLERLLAGAVPGDFR